MLIPALDIINTKIVRLYQGNYDLVQYYDYDLYDMLEQYRSSGVKMVHLVDLDGARNPNIKQKIFFSEIINCFKDYIQIAGGIRNTTDIEYLLSLGAKRVVIGSSIIHNIKEVKKWIQLYGNEYIVAALDIHISKENIKTVFINGWKKDTGILLESILEELLSVNIKHVLCTDISRDGTLLGPNFQLYEDLSNKFNTVHFQASGGISSIHDILTLKKIGVQNVIIGKSLLENKFTIVEALKCWQKGLSPVLM